ncbi:thiolase [Drechmeria coniospora]|uniref:Thiolase n=1 Tax=Drechmeria coniospora TaxID=98403 RepID=A0A151GIX6_DRECN|nr:thiolase [Drechmeria coniospora]KYK57001.1 thiolase [Drechmeria coniospora]
MATMVSKPAVPIIVGVGDFRNKSLQVQDAMEPAQLMVKAVESAIADTGLGDASRKELLSHVDSLRIVPTWTWAYRDLASLVAGRLGIEPSHTESGYHGGNQPALQCDKAAKAIAARESSVAILAGGEALASLAACQKAGQNPPPGWPEQDPDGKNLGSIDMSILRESVGTRHSMGLPIHVYPLYENSRRAHRRQTADRNSHESATMYAAFDRIASKNEHSWNYGEPTRSAEVIGTISKRNRMIFWERRHYHQSSAISQSIDAALNVSGLTKEDIDCYDFYSQVPSFSSAVLDGIGLTARRQLLPHRAQAGVRSSRPLDDGGGETDHAARWLDIPRRLRMWWLTTRQAINAMTRELRAGRGKNGLILANGGMLTHQHALCLSAKAPSDERGYPTSNPLPPIAGRSTRPFVETAEGRGTIEVGLTWPGTVLMGELTNDALQTYTVEYDRQGSPAMGLIVGVLQTGERFLANHGDEQTLAQLASSSVEHVGQAIRVRPSEGGRNLFTLDWRTNL